MTGLSSKKSSSRISRSTNPLENYRFADHYNECERKNGIKFTRKFSNQYKPCCCILSCLIISFLSACTFLYCAYLYVKVENGEELSFRGSFTVIFNDTYQPALLNSSTESNESKIAVYERALENAIHVQPNLRLAFMSADILDLDDVERKPNSTVHFEVKFNPRLLFGGDTNSIIHTIKEHLRIPNGIVDIESISLRETHSASMVAASSLSPRIAPPSHILDDNFSNDLGQCTPITQLPFCSSTESNLTSFPNLFMHRDATDMKNDLIIFRELIDAECFDNAAEFLCQVLQPTCLQRSNSSAETYLPCKQFCDEFVSGCGSRFNERLKQSLDCSKFPQYSTVGKNCHKQPNCNIVSPKKDDPFNDRMCDGIPDCTDMEDELGCPYCKNGVHCGLTKNCIPSTNYCDDVSDCEDDSDEKNCLSLSSDGKGDLQYKTALDARNPREGYAVYTNRGIPAYVKVNHNNNQEILRRTGELFCKSGTYQNVSEVEIKTADNTTNENCVEVEAGNDSEISFIHTNNCSSDGLLYIKCSNFECGLQTTRTNSNSIEGLNKLATNGDWPWYAALFKNGIHSCDATLISDSWLLTTVSCFQGQSRAEWIARLGSVRLHSKSPWQQERHIVGMVKSPVEGSTLVLLKLSNPVIYSHFVRPICLPLNHSPAEELTYCNALGWSKNRALQRIEVKETALDNCADMSIMMSNGLCAASVFHTDECDEEELAGSAMLCLTSQQNRWVLIGVSNWRISCTPVEMRRPRLYDKVATNVNWIRSVINEA